jgi:dihydroorotate dehydrogenase
MLYRFLRPVLFQMPPERAHDMAITALSCGLVPSQPVLADERLHMQLAGLALPNPVGLAAGFDKNAQTLPHIFRQGFGFAEVGTITPKPQEGNPKPRVFRLPQQEAIINRLGFNNEGLAGAQKALAKPQHGIVGANIGKNKDSADAVADYVTGLRGVYGLCDYITINISSPNTEGLRALQEAEALQSLLSALVEERQRLAVDAAPKPLFVKIAPDMDQAALEALLEVVLAHAIDGLIVSNTTIQRPDGIPNEVGGLSGKPLYERSTAMLRLAYQLTHGKLPLIGVGGIASAEDAYGKIKAGASAVQLYTALVYQGFGLVTRIKQGLLACLERDGIPTLAAAVGVEAA